jgi:hypothetical protein
MANPGDAYPIAYHPTAAIVKNTTGSTCKHHKNPLAATVIQSKNTNAVHSFIKKSTFLLLLPKTIITNTHKQPTKTTVNRAKE